MANSMTSTIAAGQAPNSVPGPPSVGQHQSSQQAPHVQVSTQTQYGQPNLVVPLAHQALKIPDNPERVWKQLTQAEKLKCIDNRDSERIELEGRYGTRYGWPCASAVKPHWDRIQACISTILSARVNYERIMKGLHHEEGWSIRVLMVSNSSRCRGARPAIGIGSARRRIGKRACQILQDHGSRLTDYPGFDFLAYKERILLIAGSQAGQPFQLSGLKRKDPEELPDDSSISAGTVPVVPKGSEPLAIPVLTAPWPGHDGGRWRKATIGGIVRVGHNLFGLTVSHAFKYNEAARKKAGSLVYDSDESDLDADMSDCASFDDSDSDSDSDTDLSDWTSSIGQDFHTTSTQSVQDESKFVVYSSRSSLAKIGPNTSVFSAAPREKELVGTVTRSVPNRKPQISFDHDWALVELKQQDLGSFFSFSYRRRYVPYPESVALTYPKGDVVVISGHYGVVETYATGTPCGLRLPGSPLIKDVFTIKCKLGPGDSGSWVVKRYTKELCGIVVAISPAFGQCYCLPVNKIFQSIETAWGSGTNVSLFRPDLRRTKPRTTEERTNSVISPPEEPLANLPPLDQLASFREDSDLLSSNNEIQEFPRRELQSLLQTNLSETINPVQRQDSPAVQAFLDWLIQNFKDGISISSDYDTEQNAQFVPTGAIFRYLRSPGRVTNILQELFSKYQSQTPPVDTDIILDHFSLVLAILLYIGKGTYIPLFTRSSTLSDSQLPFKRRPDLFPSPKTTIDGPNEDFFETFQKYQYIFCAPIFEYHRSVILEREHVVPMVPVANIYETPGIQMSSVRIHPAHDCLHPPQDPNMSFWLSPRGKDEQPSLPASKRCFSIKIYRANNHEQYEQDVYVLTELHKDVNASGILPFYGSYVHGPICNIILEYAQGTLEDYWRTNTPPSTVKDLHIFWESMFELFEALASLKRIRSKSEFDSGLFPRFLYRLDPTHILVSRRVDASPYDCQFMLDFSSISSKMDETDAVVSGQSSAYDRSIDHLDIYDAPELLRDDTAPAPGQTKFDIWSLGCVYLDAVAWLVSYEGPTFSERMKLHLFHLLESPEWTLPGRSTHYPQELKPTGMSRDNITGRILDSLLNRMLCHCDYRLEAVELHEMAQKLLDVAGSELKQQNHLKSMETSSKTSFFDSEERNEAIKDVDTDSKGASVWHALEEAQRHKRHTDKEALQLRMATRQALQLRLALREKEQELIREQMEIEQKLMFENHMHPTVLDPTVIDPDHTPPPSPRLPHGSTVTTGTQYTVSRADT